MPSALSIWPWNSRGGPQRSSCHSFPSGGTPGCREGAGNRGCVGLATSSVRLRLRKLPFNFLITLSSPAAQPASWERWVGVELTPRSRSPGGFDKAGAGASSASSRRRTRLFGSNLEEFLPTLSPHQATQIWAQAQRELGSGQARVPNVAPAGHALCDPGRRLHLHHPTSVSPNPEAWK